MTLEVDIARLVREMHTLAGFTDAEQSGQAEERAVTRIVFTQHDMDARAWLKTLYAEAGLIVRDDAVGNTFARWVGTEPDEPAVGTGSHTDAIPHAGMYDGTLGVLGGLEAIRTLQRAGATPRRSIELLMLTSEEPTRFGIGCLGSRLIAGTLDSKAADSMRDVANTTLFEARTAAGFHGDLASVRLTAEAYGAWVELHIEQGSLLERDSVDIGVVSHIAAPASYRFTLRGAGGHAGALLMPNRRDALCAAAEVILAIERAALSSGAIDTVATVGTVEVYPGAVNSVPSRVVLQLDLRDTDPDRREGAMQQIRQAAADVSQRRHVSIEEDVVNADPPAACSVDLVQAIENSCQTAGLSHRRLVSRAYHDSLFMAQIAPVAMIFVPCRSGVSHRPDEFVSEDAMKNGVR
ncbi:MAG: M20 family metallo-hydrolase, partial [Janthinobacterium lividum]